MPTAVCMYVLAAFCVCRSVYCRSKTHYFVSINAYDCSFYIYCVNTCMFVHAYITPMHTCKRIYGMNACMPRVNVDISLENDMIACLKSMHI